MTLRLLVASLILASLPAAAQTQDAPLRFPLVRMLSLAEDAHLTATGFQRALGDIVALTIEAAPELDTPFDPFLWSLSGSFARHAQTGPPGAIFGCARYGLATRDLLAENGLTAPETFVLLGYARPQFDDGDVWPEGAVARLFCTFVWDDARVVEILPEAPVRQALALTFDTLTVLNGAARNPAIYGEEGFRIDATGGPASSVAQVESARVTLTLGHQSVSFRSFLMGGGA